MLGASIEYYDIALYGYLAPILVPNFLPYLEKTTAYFWYFIFEFIASLFQILGARYYGKIGDIKGRKHAVFLSMIGTSFVTFTISFLPTYYHIGIYATILFCIARVLQSFFLGGEYNGGAIYCLENEKNSSKHGFVSGLYCAFTVSGIIVASIVATVVNFFGAEYFRLAYAVSFIFCVIVYFLRKNMQETLSLSAKEEQKIEHSTKYILVPLVISSLFFGVLYGLPTKIFNTILPIAIGINTNLIMIINNLSLFLYITLLILFGYISDKYGWKKMMHGAAAVTVFISYPLFLLLNMHSILLILFVKVVFIILTAAFVSPFHAWAQYLFRSKQRYRGISTNYAIGKSGSTILLACSFLIFQEYNNLQVVSVILIAVSCLTVGALFYERS